MHQLVIDIGNSFIKTAIFKKGKLLVQKRYNKFLVRDIKEINKKFPFENVIVSSVRKSLPNSIQHLAKHFHLLIMKHNTKVQIENLYKTPKTLGLDRLAGAVGAHTMFKQKNVLIIDLGTCIKYDFVDKNGRYHGGNIAPGLEMRLESMHLLTSKLPRVKKNFNEDLLGKSTKEALQNGAVWGIKLEIERFIKTLTKKKGKLTVILTGGDSKYFGEIIESKIFVIPNLVLQGLDSVLTYNLNK